jgi:tetratricopeptide (TPR) repeat protein/serine/threonine protein kinase
MAMANPRILALSEADRQVLQSWLAKFDQAWDENKLALWVRQLPPAPSPLRLPALIEMIKIDLERQWQRNRRAVVEAYLKFYPELGTAETVPADLLFVEYRVRRQFNAPAELMDFARRFPSRVHELQKLVEENRSAPAAVSESSSLQDSDDRSDTTRADERPPAAPLPLPEKFGRYRILSKLGKGGMGTVYLAEDTQLDHRRVALKVPHFTAEDGPDVLGRFHREARAAAIIDHPNICAVYDVGQIEGTHYLAMKYIEGKPLSKFIQPGRALPQQQVAALVRKLALAVQEAHNRGVIHRDLKPANIMIDQRGEPIIMDFGLARRLTKNDVRLTQSGALVGTPAYMAPEQVDHEGKVQGPGCDIYSLGIILYELVAGELPFRGQLTALLCQILLEEPPPLQKYRVDIDPQLEAICRKALAKQPENRFASMKEMAAALEAYLRKTIPPPVSTPPRTSPAASQLPRAVPVAEPIDPRQAIQATLPNREVATASATVPVEASNSIRPALPMTGATPDLSVRTPLHSWFRRRLLGRYPLGWVLAAGTGGLALLILVLVLLLPRGSEERPTPPGNGGGPGKNPVVIQPIGDDPKLAASKFEEGVKAFNKQEWDGALQLFSEALAAKKDHIEALHYRGRTYLQKHDNLKAIADLDEAIRHNSKHALAYAYRGLAHIEQGLFTDDATKYAQGIADCNRARDYDSKLALAYAFRAFGYLPTDYKQAIKDCDKALELDGKLALAYAIRGRAQFFPRQYDIGLDDCDTALGIDPRLAKAYHYRGYLQYQKEFDRGELTTKSLLDYNKAIELDPNYAIVYVDRGNWYYRAKQYDLGFRDYETALRLQPDYIFALNGRGNIHDARKNYPQAIADYTAAINLDQNPYNCVFYTNRGNTYTRPGFQDWDKAESDFKKAIKIQSNYVNNYVGLALVYEGRKDFAKAIEYHNEAIKLNPKEARLHANLGFAYFRKPEPDPDKRKMDLDKAQAAFEKALEIDEKNSLAHQGLASICNANKEYDQAIEHYTKSIESEPHPDTFRLRGDLYLHQKKDYLRALEDYMAPFEMDPNNPKEQDQVIADLGLVITANGSFVPAYIQRSRVYAQKKFFDRAFEDADQAVKLSPKDPAAWNARGWVWLQKEKLDKALDDFNEALNQKDNFAPAYRNRGTVHLRKEKYNQAITDFGKAIQYDKKDYLAFNGRGLAHLKKGELDDAEKDFTAALRLNKDFAEAYHNRGKTYAARKDYARAVEEYNQALVCDPTVAAVYRSRAEALRKLGQGAAAKADEETAKKLEAT